MRVRICALILGVLLFSGGLTQAEVITIQISGEITSLGGDVGSIPDTIYAGVPFTGSYTYESSASDSDSDPKMGRYVYDSPYGISISVGGYEFKTASSHTGQFEIRIRNDDASDEMIDAYFVLGEHENVSDPSVDFTVNSINWYLVDSTHDAVSSDALLTTAPVLADWNGNELTIVGSGVHALLITGTVTQATPEPLTGVLLATGIFFLRKRR